MASAYGALPSATHTGRNLPSAWGFRTTSPPCLGSWLLSFTTGPMTSVSGSPASSRSGAAAGWYLREAFAANPAAPIGTLQAPATERLATQTKHPPDLAPQPVTHSVGSMGLAAVTLRTAESTSKSKSKRAATGVLEFPTALCTPGSELCARSCSVAPGVFGFPPSAA